MWSHVFHPHQELRRTPRGKLKYQTLRSSNNYIIVFHLLYILHWGGGIFSILGVVSIYLTLPVHHVPSDLYLGNKWNLALDFTSI